jgi:hypothetical protein
MAGPHPWIGPDIDRWREATSDHAVVLLRFDVRSRRLAPGDAADDSRPLSPTAQRCVRGSSGWKVIRYRRPRPVLIMIMRAAPANREVRAENTSTGHIGSPLTVDQRGGSSFHDFDALARVLNRHHENRLDGLRQFKALIHASALSVDR